MEQKNHNTKTRKWKHLSEKDRYKIEALAQHGLSPARIGNSLEPKRDRRTIERELARGMTLQRNSDLTEKYVYLADVGQRIYKENAVNKGRNLKIGYDHKLADYIENKIKNEKWSPDTIIGSIKKNEISFGTIICTKTVYNYIDAGIFRDISNNDLWVKKNKKRKTTKRFVMLP